MGILILRIVLFKNLLMKKSRLINSFDKNQRKFWCLVFSVLGTKFRRVINVPLAFISVYHIKHHKPSGSSRLRYVLSSNSHSEPAYRLPRQR